ncbi:MAG: hypothetical protein ACRCX2_05005 [Paraclostridium sp.]
MSRTPYLDLNIPDKSSKGFVVTDVFEPNFTKLDQEAERVNLRKMSTEDNIEELKKATRYKAGDVVEVLGYYTKGDGAGHPRQKKPVGYNGVDAVIGNDGSIWGIVHNGEINVSWFGLNDDMAKNTLNINKALSMSRTSFETLVFPSKKIRISKLDFENFVDKKIKFNNTTFLAWDSAQQDYCVRFIQIANATVEGQLTVWGGGKTNYNCGIFIDSENEGGRQVNVSTFDNIVSMWFKLGFRIGSSATNDSLLSENSFSNFKTFYCARALEFNGSQNVNTFINCNFVTGGGQAETAFGFDNTYDCITVNGGAPTFIGGEIVAHTTQPNQSVTIRVNPCISSTYGKTYPKIICSGVHIETGKSLFFIDENTNTISNISGMTFDNCGGFVYLNPEASFSEINDTNYEGLIRIKNSNFYSHTVKRAAMNLYSKSNKAKLDIDLSCFGQGFVQGKIGVAGGIFKENNHLIFKLSATAGVISQGDIPFTPSSVYDVNYTSILQNGKIVVPKGVKLITINGLVNKQTLTDLVIRKNNEDFSYTPAEKSSIIAIIPVKKGDIISLYSYGSNTLNNLLVNVYVDVELEYEDTISRLLVLNPVLKQELEKRGIYEDYARYAKELHEYEKQQNIQSDTGVMNLNVIQPPAIPEKVEEYAKEYNLI